MMTAEFGHVAPFTDVTMIPFRLFRVGDKVVYPNHGVGTVEHISNRYLGGVSEQFYLVRIETSNMRVMVPFASVDTVGMRPVAREDDVSQTLNFLQCGECCPHTDWKDRFKENSEKMRTGSLLHVAQVLKSLLLLHRAKPLSFREKKMLDRAVVLLVNELASSRCMDPGEATELVRQALAAAQLELPTPETADA
jgi:CarD family transcriptional regulator